MTNLTIGVIGLVILVIMLFSKMWIGASMILVGFIGCWLFAGFDTAFSILGTVPYTQSTDYTLTCMPMFVLMGLVLSYSGLAADLFDCAKKWLGRIRGGLAMATAVACGLFAAVCGDSVTTAVTMSKVVYPSMREHKYSDRIIGGIISAGGSVGVLIPPSICFIIYGMITQQSIGSLFIAGIIPGVLQVLFYIIVIMLLGKLKPDWVPKGEKYTMKEKLHSSKNVWPVLLLFVIIIGGIYGGFFTATEAGAFGAFAAIVISLLNKRLNKQVMISSFKESILNTAMVFFLISGAYVFLRFMAFSGLPNALGDFVIGLYHDHGVSPFWIMIAILFMYIIMGMFMDVIACIFMTLGIVYPIVQALGFDLIWFGVVTVRVMQMGMISPPFGLNLFAVSKSTNLPMKDVFLGVVPFFIADIIHTIVIIAIPALSLWLPGLM